MFYFNEMYRRAPRVIWNVVKCNHYMYKYGLNSIPTVTPSPLVRFCQFRQLHLDVVRYAPLEKSKVEETLNMLREEVQQQEKEAVYLAKKKAETPAEKPPLMKRIVDECKHYYHGFRLLVLETRLSARYLWRLARGQSLMRKERQQLVRTASDLFRLVPFSIFVIVPFLEFTLPIFLKFFPNMLPSTFQEESKEKEKLKRRLKVKLEVAKFLQDTIDEIGLERKSKGQAESKASEFAAFIKKVRSEGGYVSTKELFKYTKLFQDELTLDNLAMGTLRALCKLLDITPLGTPEILRFQLNLKLRELRADDKEIALEGGVEALNVAELQSACRARGMRSLGMSEQRLRNQLKQWLELSLNDKVPPSLLLLSRTLYLPEDIPFTERLKALLTMVPEDIAEQTRQKLTELEGNKVAYKERLDLIRNIEKAIKEERKATEEAKLKREADEKAKVEAKKEAEAVAAAAAAPRETLEFEPVMAAAPAEEVKKPEEVATVDEKGLKSIEDVIHGSAVSEAKHDITELKEKVQERTEDLIEVDALKKDLSEPKGAKRLRRRVTHILENLDTLVDKMEKERKTIHETIADPAVQEAALKKKAHLMRVDDLVNSLNRLRKMPDEEKRQEIEQVVRALDDDTDGLIDPHLVLQAIDLLSRHKDLEVSAAQIKKIVEMLRKEEEMDALEAFISGLSPYPPAPSEKPKKQAPPESVPLPEEVKDRPEEQQKAK